MQTVKTLPEFEKLTEEQVLDIIDTFEEGLDDDEEFDEEDFSEANVDPVVSEVSRLINEYTNKFDDLCKSMDEDAELPEEIFNYAPEVHIERIAYEIFLDVLHDSLQEEDDEGE